MLIIKNLIKKVKSKNKKHVFYNIKIGIAPIGWANDDLTEIGKECTYQQILSEIALAKYDGTEIGNKFPKDILVLKKQLNLRKLKIASAWFSSYILKNGLKKTLIEFKKHIAFLKQLNAKVVVVCEQSKSIQQQKLSLFNNKPELNETEWNTLAIGLNQLGLYAKTQGLKLVYHHHMGTVIQTASETSKILKLTDPKLVFLLFDTGHFFMANEDPIKLVLKYKKRIAHVHLKDVRLNIKNNMIKNKTCFLDGVIEGMFTVPGNGAINFDNFFANLAKINYQNWLIVEAEQDPKKADPFEYALKAMKFIKNKIEIKKIK